MGKFRGADHALAPFVILGQPQAIQRGSKQEDEYNRGKGCSGAVVLRLEDLLVSIDHHQLGGARLDRRRQSDHLG